MIHILISLMTLKGSLDDLLKMIFIHPALPEIIRDAARDASGKLK
jgi:dihydrolipoamide dehydrogenase